MLAWVSPLISAELVVNVKNQGGEVFQESIGANVTDETINLKVQQPDGTYITQFIDFRNEIQIINVMLLGEEEQREALYQVLCFVTHFKKTEFIPPDAMAKLRQKNPWTVRIPEKDLGKENVTLDVLLDITSSDWVSPHIKTVCSDAKDGTYAKREDLEALLSSKLATGVSQGANINEVEGNSVEAHEHFLRAVKPFPIVQQDCSSTKDLNKPCSCELELCIGWYPCALKYCRGRDTGTGSKSSPYRCGIHTCKLCRHHRYSVPRRFSCLSRLNSY
ncbi:unnamed protein product [Allacma fusca]|uniref:Out at first protein n=1 Tax=Allacma fusca TaxID=39272 RepID=A0A8J2Q0X5_9HEXA|nr:unnamed protein product [Allacma fusca]